MSESTEHKSELNSFDIEKILDALPHRYPMLMVDKIIEMNRDESCIGIKNVTFNEPQFVGHFPRAPIFPGVLLIEGMAQTAGALCVNFRGTDARPEVVYFLTIDKAKFRKPVIPGDRVEYHMTKIKQRGKIWWFLGKAMVDGKVAAQAEVSAMLVDNFAEG